MDCDPFPHIDLSCLTQRQREVVEMHYCHCLTFGQIALFLDSTYDAVAHVHFRAIAKLRVNTADYKLDA